MNKVNVTSSGVNLDTLIDEIVELIEEKEITKIKPLLQNLDDLEALYIVNQLHDKQQVVVFRLLNKENALFVFEQLDTPVQKELLHLLADEMVVELIEELDVDDRVELLDELPAKVASKLISELSPEERKLTNILMGYEPETAGRIMTPKFVAIAKNITVGEALKKIRTHAKGDHETIYTLYVTDKTKKLEGVLELKDILAADNDVVVADIMNDIVVSVTTGTDQEKAANALREYDLLAIPVVDSEGRMVGIITVDDAMDILEFEAGEDMLDQAGFADVAGTEYSRSDILLNGNLWRNWKVRLPFLAIALVGGLAAALLIDGFKNILEQVIILTLFVPLVMDLGGSISSQSSTVFARGFALGQVDVGNFGKRLFREVLIGFSIGVIIGVVAGVVAGVWGHLGDTYDQGLWRMGLVVGLSLICTITVASLIGFLTPYLLVRMKVDQVAASAPIVTTIKDLTGIAIYFGFAVLFFSQLLGYA